MNEWAETTIGDICDVFDGPHATPAKSKSGPWFLSISSLVDGRLDLSKSDHLSREDFVKWTRRVTPRHGDVLFSYETRLGDAALMPDGIEACLGRRMALLRANRSRVLPSFLLYAYRSPSFQEVIRQRAIHGATVDRIPLVELPGWPVLLPSLREQQAIGDLLGAMDGKIDSNCVSVQKLAELLEYEYLLAMKRPRRVLNLREVVDLKYGKALPETARVRGPVPVYGGNGVSGSHNVALVGSSGIVVGRKGANAGSVSWSSGPFWPIDTAFYVDESKLGIPLEFVYFLLRNAKLRGLVGDSAIPGLNRDTAYSCSLALPDRHATEKFSLEAKKVIAFQRSLGAESLLLSQLRDVLLAKLMSGDIRIKDAEKIVGDST